MLPRFRVAVLLVSLAGTCACLGPAGAPTVHRPFAANADLVSPSPLGIEPDDEDLHLRCTLAGLPAGVVRVHFQRSDEERRLDLEGHTTGLADLLLSLAAEASSTWTADGEGRFALRSRQRDRFHHRTLDYGEPCRLWWCESEDGPGQRCTLPRDGGIDPLRLLHEVRIAPPVAEQEFRLLTALRSQHCRVRALGTTTGTDPAGAPCEVDVLELRIGATDEATRPLSGGRCSVWWLHLSRDARRLPVLLEHDTPMGRLRVECVSSARRLDAKFRVTRSPPGTPRAGSAATP